MADSAAASRKHILDSSRAAQAKYLDSVKTARQVELDRMNAIRKKRTDSLAAIRKYKESRRYRDSVEKAKERRLDSIQTVRKARTDSITAARKRVTDSTIAVRKAVTDSIKAIQKKRSDSLGKIRKYRESKRYADSVQVVRKLRADSIKDIREARADSLMAARKKITDSAAAARKARADSVTAARKVISDSLAAARKIKSDSLAQMKAKREKDSKLREKQKEDKAKLALEVKIKRKQEAYNNENMLKKRWAFPRSVMQNTTTRFNYYFNANQKMDEAIENMQRFRKENYESLIPLYPFNPDRDSSVLAPDMDSIIHKASLGIQIHDPRTKWGDDLYLLLGQASYYKGDYKNATDAFKYTVSLRDKKKKKKKSSNSRPKPKGPSSVVVEEKRGISGIIAHRSVHNEAILWLARVLTQQHKEGEAESVLDLVETDPNFSGSLAGRIALEKSFIRLSQQDYKGAITPLTQVTTDKKLPDWIRRRAAYINGQLQQRYGDYTASVESFKAVISMHPPVDMDFYSKKNLATSQMLAGGDQKDAIVMLKGILKDGKFSQYYEQVYFLLGQLSVNSGNQEEAITYLNKAITAPRSTEANKAQSYATLGDIYYGQRKYEYAKNSYDSAAAFMGDNPEGEQMQTALRRSVVLGNLTTPLRTIRHNDSLLRLSEMDEKEQRAVVRRYIKVLEDRRADSLFEAENAGVNAAMKNTGNSSASGTRNNYANWYFSNGAQMQKGFNDFKQKWGSRPLADNWRRSNAGGGFVQNDLSNSGNEAGVDNSGIPTEESLLAAIPKTKAEKDTALLEIRTAYVAGANAYVKDLEDYPPAVDMLDTLDRRFPKHEFDAEALYLRYMIAVKQSKFDSAKLYKNQLQAEHPNSEWAKLVQPTEDGNGAALALSVVAKHYDSTYSYMLNRYYDTSLARSKEGQHIYRQSPYQDRFQIIEATSQAMLENYNAADSVLNIFMTKHTDPNDSLKRWGDALLKYVSEKKAIVAKRIQDSLSRIDTAKRVPVIPQGEPIAAPGAAAPGEQGKPPVEPVVPASAAPVSYVFNGNEEHYAVFTFKAMEQRTKGVQAAIDDFSKFKFGSLQLQTEVQMLTPTSGVILVKKFANKNQALIYVNSLKKTKQIFREYQPGEYEVLMISSSNYIKLATDKNLEEYMRFYKSKY